MRPRARAGWIAAAALSVAGALGAQSTAKPDLDTLALRAKVLEAESGLAKASASYMIIDVPAKRIQLKARGFVLRSWDIRSARAWGRPAEPKALKLEARIAISKPERKNITPGKEDPNAAKAKTPSSEPELLEVKDMPVHYSLSFGDDIRVTIKPKTTRFWPSLVNVSRGVSSFFYLPLKTLWLSLKHRSFTEIEIQMPTETDAKSLYWAFIEGLGAVIVGS